MNFRLRAFVSSACFAAMSAFTMAAHADDDDRYFRSKLTGWNGAAPREALRCSSLGRRHLSQGKNLHTLRVANQCVSQPNWISNASSSSVAKVPYNSLR